MLDPRELEIAVDLAQRGYRLLRWIEGRTMVRAWEDGFAKGERGYATGSLVDYVRLVEDRRKMMDLDEYADQILPPARHVPPGRAPDKTGKPRMKK